MDDRVREIAGMAEGLTVAERADLIEVLRIALEAALGEGAGEPDRCPRCGCRDFVRRGRDASGAQRWLCKGCGRSFGGRTGTLLGSSRLPASTWLSYAVAMVDGLTLRAAAERCGVSLRTSFFMRHRVCEAMEAFLPAFSVGPGGLAQIDECFCPVGAGGRANGAPFPFARAPYQRGRLAGGARPWRPGRRAPDRGPLDSYCVVCCVSDEGGALVEGVGPGRLRSGSAMAAVEAAGVAGATVCTDGTSAYDEALERAGAAHHVKFKASWGQHCGVNRVNSLHSRLKEFFRGFRGVSVRRIGSYLTWFSWTEAARRQGPRAELIDLLCAQMRTARARTTWRGMWEVPYPPELLASTVG